jgi:hypothetical protein
MPRRRTLLVALTAIAVLTAACGATDAAGPDPVPAGTLAGVGELPPAVGASESLPIAPSRPTIEPIELGEVGERSAGNRVIVIGDSIMASTSQRFGGEMCLALVPQHWAVEVSAETGRFVEFGTRVLDRRLRPEEGLDWDAAVVMLGNNYRTDEQTYAEELFAILDRLAPRPVVLFTVTEFRPDRAEVNRVVREMVRYYPELQVVDWAAETALDPSLLAGDGLHLSTEGRARLAELTAAALGEAPTGEGGECLTTSFTDDSAADLPGSSSGGSSGSGSSGSGSSTRPTAAPTTTTDGDDAGTGGGGTDGEVPSDTTAPSEGEPPDTTAPPGSTPPPVTTAAPDTTAVPPPAGPPVTDAAGVDPPSP